MTQTAQQAGRPRAPRAPRRLPYLVRQLITLVVTLFAITIVIFGLTAIAGDPARDILGQYATDEQVTAFQQMHHLDQPVVVRYFEWLGGVLSGDLGTSYQSNGPVWDVISPRLGPSIVLVLLPWVLTVVISVPIGLYSGVRLRGRRDASLTFVTLIVAAFPEFVLGLMLAILFGVWLAWLPVDSTAVSYGGLFDSPSAYVLPAITIALGTIPYIIRLMRANARESGVGDLRAGGGAARRHRAVAVAAAHPAQRGPAGGHRAGPPVRRSDRRRRGRGDPVRLPRNGPAARPVGRVPGRARWSRRWR